MQNKSPHPDAVSKRQFASYAWSLHRGGPCRRRAAKVRQLDHRSDLRCLDLYFCRHAIGNRLYRAEAAAAKNTAATATPAEKVVERKLAALEGGEAAILFSTGMAAFVGLLMAKLQRGRRSDLLRRVLPPQPRILHQAPLAVRRGHAAGQGLRLRRDGSRHHAADQAPGQRIADESASEHRRSGAFRGNRQTAWHRDPDRCHAGHSL